MTAPVEVKILVVDDNPGTRYATSRVLRAAGFTVIEAATGRDGLAASDKVDLVVLDINLPDIDGFEVCREIRANKTTARTPVIHLSATFVQERDKVRGLNFGADGYLTHPVEAPVLIATINAFLRARQAEDAMWTSEAKFRAIFDQMPHGIALVSEDFVYLEVNPALCRILGRAREQIVGKHNSAFMPLGQERQVVAIAQQLQNTGTWRGTAAMVRSDASHVELEWTISNFSVPGVRLAMITDITDRRRIEDEREKLLASERAARSEAEKANRLKDDFLATLSHELRTPLNAIVGWTEILRRGKPDPADYAEGLESIERNVRVQSQLIADLLDVSRITTGKLRLAMKAVDADVIINSALDAVGPTATAKNITLHRKLGAGGKLLADPIRLQQVIWNLVSNAVKFTPDGGTVEVALSFSDTFMSLAVTDTGQGIAPDFLPYLFDRFSQADASARRIHGGLGIGLAIVKNIVEMHGGTVLATSEGPGKGATFTITIPLVRDSRTATPSPPGIPVVQPLDLHAPRLEMTLDGIRVLVVDDDSDSRKVLTRMLNDFEATVDDAENVQLAIEALDKFKPDILISDIGMPGQDGYDLVRHLRKRPDQYARLPAIALTAFSGDENVKRAIREGFQAHLAKPVNPANLVLLIAKLVGRTAL